MNETIWIAHGYDGSIAGPFLTIHDKRPLPDELGVEVITQANPNGSFEGTIADGYVHVVRIARKIQDGRPIYDATIGGWKPVEADDDEDLSWKEGVSNTHCRYCGKNETHIEGCLDQREALE